MKKLLSFFALVLVFSLFLVGCGPEESEEDATEDNTEEVAEQEQRLDATGVWVLTIMEGGGRIDNTVFIYPLGLAETVSGVVTTPEGYVGYPNFRGTGQNWASYVLDGYGLTMHALNGSSTSRGTLTDDSHASGTITSQAGTYSWTATRVSDLPDGYEILGYWMMNIQGWGEGEIARFQSLYLGADGRADTDWIKVQTETGETHEGDMPDYLSSFTYEDGVVFIESNDGSVTFQGTYSIDGDGAEVLEGVWHNSATNETGTWEAVKMD